MAVSVPVFDDVTLPQMTADPYPTYARLRAEAPVAWLAPAGIHLVTRFDDIARIERDPDTFPARDTRSLQVRVMGHSMMRKDGEDHRRERAALEPTFKPAVARAHWAPAFEAICEDLLDDIAGRGRADLFAAYAAPAASRALKAVLGLPDVDWRELCAWSQALMDAVGIYGGDEAVFARGRAASEGIDAAIERQEERLRTRPDPSALSSMLHAEPPLTREQIRANVKVIVGGGLNEPRDAIATALMGLLATPGAPERLGADPALRRPVFEEAVRWIAPIGMYPRRVARRVEIGGAVLEEGDALGLSVASACHDEAHFEAGHRFDPGRERRSHLAFGAGAHFCLGTWVARLLVGEIAVPRALERLPRLRLDPDAPPEVRGWVFRGPTALPVLWDA